MCGKIIHRCNLDGCNSGYGLLLLDVKSFYNKLIYSMEKFFISLKNITSLVF